MSRHIRNNLLRASTQVPLWIRTTKPASLAWNYQSTHVLKRHNTPTRQYACPQLGRRKISV